MDQKVLPPELDALANEVGDFVCYWGFKKVHGRIWTHLYLSDNALDAGEIIQRLKISKALVSLSLNDLLRYEVILEAGKSERGTQLYVANPNLMQVILNVIRSREQKMLEKIDERFKSLTIAPRPSSAGASIADSRLEKLGQFIGQASLALHAFVNFSNVDFKTWAAFSGGEPPRP